MLHRSLHPNPNNVDINKNVVLDAVRCPIPVPAAPPLIALDTLRFVGAGLVRPECVLATAAGALYTADWRGGVACTGTDGSSTLFQGALPAARPLRPNGIALRRDGSFLLADPGDSMGGVFVLDRNGEGRPLLVAVDGIDLPPTNFVFEDDHERV